MRVTLLYFNTVISWTRYKNMKNRFGGDWTKFVFLWASEHMRIIS